MTAAPQRYPLAWPAHRPRTRASARARGTFSSGDKRISIEQASVRLEEEVERLGGVYPVLSTNLELRMDGRPRADRGPPADPGVCLYFAIKTTPYAMACDSFSEVAQNIAAIAEHIKASRAIARYGVATAAETLQAFAALPPPDAVVPQARPWPEVFGLMRDRADMAAVNTLYRVKAAAAASAGNDAAILELNLARDAARKELGA